MITVIVIGRQGAGKTTVAKAIARALQTDESLPADKRRVRLEDEETVVGASDPGVRVLTIST
jgi:shikimate kinase